MREYRIYFVCPGMLLKVNFGRKGYSHSELALAVIHIKGILRTRPGQYVIQRYESDLKARIVHVIEVTDDGTFINEKFL